MLRKLLAVQPKILLWSRMLVVQKFKCWNCTTTHDHQSVFCNHCKLIQPVHPDSDFFSYFGLKRRYSLDEDALKHKFRLLQTHVHPDKYGTSTGKEKQLSEQHSSYLNQAYKTLKSPRARAKYLLRLLTQENQAETTSSEFASEMFEFIAEFEDETDLERLKVKAEEVNNEVESLLIRIENAFDKDEVSLAKELLIRLRYYDRARKILDNKSALLSRGMRLADLNQAAINSVMDKLLRARNSNYHLKPSESPSEAEEKYSGQDLTNKEKPTKMDVKLSFDPRAPLDLSKSTPNESSPAK